MCQASFFLRGIPQGQCDEGLECVKRNSMAFGRGVCVKKDRKRKQPTQYSVQYTLVLLLLFLFLYLKKCIPMTI